jgi:hypothetical protein
VVLPAPGASCASPRHTMQLLDLCLLTFPVLLYQVGLCSAEPAAAPGTPAAAAAAGSPSPASFAGLSPSRFGPAQTPALNPAEVQLIDLAQRAGISNSNSSSSTVKQQQQQQLPGQLLLPVVIWPCARLARGSALLSPGAWDSLAQPPPGSYLALYEQQQQQQQPDSAGELPLLGSNCYKFGYCRVAF